MSAPKVSIITPNYNSEKFIEETYNSIFSQSEKNWEWIIVDDGSTDKSYSILENFTKRDDRVKLFQKNTTRCGASACRNIGISESSGRFLIFLDADDLLKSCCLEKRVAFMEENPFYDFAVFPMGYFEKNLGDHLGVVNKFSNKEDGYLRLFLKYEIPWQTSCPIWKGEFLKKNNISFSEQYHRLQDPEFHSKILLQHNPNFEVVQKEDPDCFYRQSLKNKPPSIESLNIITFSFLLYYKEMTALLQGKKLKKKHNKCLDSYVKNIFYSLLFYYRLNNLNPIHQLYKEMNKIRPINNIHPSLILFFGILNRTRFTFIKGVGVTRAWNVLIN